MFCCCLFYDVHLIMVASTLLDTMVVSTRLDINQISLTYIIYKSLEKEKPKLYCTNWWNLSMVSPISLHFLHPFTFVFLFIEF